MRYCQRCRIDDRAQRTHRDRRRTSADLGARFWGDTPAMLQHPGGSRVSVSDQASGMDDDTPSWSSMTIAAYSSWSDVHSARKVTV